MAGFRVVIDRWWFDSSVLAVRAALPRGWALVCAPLLAAAVSCGGERSFNEGGGAGGVGGKGLGGTAGKVGSGGRGGSAGASGASGGRDEMSDAGSSGAPESTGGSPDVGTGGADPGGTGGGHPSGGKPGGGGGSDPGGTGGAPDVLVCSATQYFDGAVCKALTKCTSTEFEAVAPAPDHDRVCKPLTTCSADQFSIPGTSGQDRQCVPLKVCAAGTFVSAKPTATTDRVCSACATGTFSSQPNADACSAWKTCASGEVQSVAPDATSDRVCSACGSGMYSLNGKCTQLTTCATTEYESKAATATTDRECKAISDCAAGSKQTAAPTKTTDRQCAVCGSNSFSTQKNSETCTTWSTCTSAQYETKAPSSTSDRVCAGLTSCAAGQRIKTAATATTDRVCESCPSGTFSTTANATSCQSWKTCGSGQGETAAGSATADRTCATCAAGTYSSGGKCVACASGTFAASPGATSCTTCSASCGWFPETACKATADTVCTKQNTARQDGTGQDDYATGMVLDKAGNVWVAVTVQNNGVWDALLYKYDSKGTKVKTISINTTRSDQAVGVVLDAAGNVWIGGSSWVPGEGNSYRSFAARFAPDGTAKGQVEFPNPSGGSATIASGVSSVGDAWLTQGTWLSHITDNGGALTLGTAVDIAQTTTNSDQVGPVEGLTVDANGNPWAAGVCTDSANGSYVFKGMSSGAIQNAKFVRFGPDNITFARPTHIRASGSNVWIVGWVRSGRYDPNDTSVPSGGFGDLDGTITRVSASDAVVHESTQFGGLYADTVSSTFVDSKGDLWIGGTVGDRFGSIDGYVYATRFTIPGSGRAQQTSETYRVNTDQPDLGGYLALDAAGHLWVAGSTQGQFPGSLSLGGVDLFVMQVAK